jgi:hypothetical protein
MRIFSNKFTGLIIAVFVSLTCSETKHADFRLAKFRYDKRGYDQYIIARHDGYHRLTGYHVADSTYGIVVVPGYYPKGWTTKGFEWVDPLRELTNFQVPIWLYRYDWNQCPEQAADRFYKKIINFEAQNPHLDSLWVIGHSYGGLIVALMAENWEEELPLTIHAIAAGMAGTNRSDKLCGFTKPSGYVIANNVRFTQWRTVHAQDGAFRALEVDPQITNLYGGIVQQLPENWGELRLGHNLSIKWVCKTLYNNL